MSGLADEIAQKAHSFLVELEHECEQLVDDNPTHVDPAGATGSVCHYLPGAYPRNEFTDDTVETPGCLIGQGLVKCGVDTDWMAENIDRGGGVTAEEALRLYLDAAFLPEDRMGLRIVVWVPWLERLQSLQDAGLTWLAALAETDADVPGDRHRVEVLGPGQLHQCPPGCCASAVEMGWRDPATKPPAN